MSNKNNPLFSKGTIINKSENYINQLLKLKNQLENDKEIINYASKTCCDKNTRQYSPKISKILKIHRNLPGTEFLNTNEELDEMLRNDLLVVNLHKLNTMVNYLFYMYDMLAYNLITRNEIIKIVCNWVETCPKTHKKLGKFFKKTYAKAVVDDFKKTYHKIKNLEKLYDSVHRVKKSKKFKALKSQKGGALNELITSIIQNKVGENLTNAIKGASPINMSNPPNLSDIGSLFSGSQASASNIPKNDPLKKFGNKIMNFLKLPEKYFQNLIDKNSEKFFKVILKFLSTFDENYTDTSHWDIFLFPLWTIEKWIPETVQLFDVIGDRIDDLQGVYSGFGNLAGGLGNLITDGVDNTTELTLTAASTIPFAGSATSGLLLAKKMGLSPFNFIRKAIDGLKWAINNSMNFVNIIFNMSRKRWSRVLRYISETSGPEGPKNLERITKLLNGAKKAASTATNLSTNVVNTFANSKILNKLADKTSNMVEK